MRREAEQTIQSCSELAHPVLVLHEDPNSDVAYCCIELGMLHTTVLLPAAVWHRGVFEMPAAVLFWGTAAEGFLAKLCWFVLGRTCLEIGFFLENHFINFAPKDKFEIGDNYEDNALSQQVVEKKCNVLHKDWKCRMKKKWEKLVDTGTNPYAHPYKGIKIDDWKYLIDEVWLDPANKRRYDAGKNNRSKLPYNHTSGSRSFPAAMSIAVKKNGGLLPDLCNFYKDTHQNKRTKQWIDPICGDLHEQMTRVRDESIEAGTPMRQEDISRVVLGKKKGYLRGFGVGPKPSSCDSGFSAASQACDEQLKRLTSELEILRVEQQSNREEQQKKEEEQQMKEAENTRQRDEMQRQLFGLQSMLAQVLENRNPPNSRQ
ncbi:hypothetical protein ACSBR1_016821 [Camellia fascicularis]